MRGSVWISVLLLIVLVFAGPGALAQIAVPAAGAQHSHGNHAGTGAHGTHSGPVNLDLTSTQASVSPGWSTSKSPVTILVGGTPVTLSNSTLLTPAERLAAFQVIRTGQQSLQLGALGNASGGSFSINPQLSRHLGNLIIPAGVTALGNAGFSGVLNISGNLVNSGSFYAFSGNSALMGVTVQAANITNQLGGVISTTLPTGLTSGNINSSLNLTLLTSNNLTNSGIISSSGALTMQAGGSIINALPSGVSGPLPVMQALGAVNLQAPAVVNQGLIASQLGNVNLATANLQNSGFMQALSASVNVQNLIGNQLMVNNTDGSILAKDQVLFETLGSVKDQAGNYLSKATLTEVGGELSADKVSFNSPDGKILVYAKQIDGGIDITGGDAQVGTQSGSLRIAHMALTGDPIYFAQGGDLDLTGVFDGNGSTVFTHGGDFIALATGDIMEFSTNVTIDTSRDPGSQQAFGGFVTLYAGFDFTVSGTVQPGPPTRIDCFSCNDKYAITGNSIGGGSLLLSNVNLKVDGSAVSMAARSTTGGGSIAIGSIDTTRANGGGPVSISASSTVNVFGDIKTNGIGAGGGGSVDIISNADVTLWRSVDTSAPGNGGSFHVEAGSGAVGILGDVNTGGLNPGSVGGDISIAGNGAVNLQGVSNASSGGSSIISISSRADSVTISGPVSAAVSSANGAYSTDRIQINAFVNLEVGPIDASTNAPCCNSQASGSSVILHTQTGDVTVHANLAGSSIDSSGPAGGLVTIISEQGKIQLDGSIKTDSIAGLNGGQVFMQAGKSIVAGNLSTIGFNGGDVILFANAPGAPDPVNSTIQVGDITTNAKDTSGHVVLFADGPITAGAISTHAEGDDNFDRLGGYVVIVSGDAVAVNGVDTSANQVAGTGLSTVTNTGGFIYVLAGGTFTSTGDISSAAAADVSINETIKGGNVVIVSGSTITVPNVYAAAQNNGGSVALVGLSGVTVTNDVNTSASDPTTGQAGGVYVSANGNITISAIEAVAPTFTQGGIVIVTNAAAAGESCAGCSISVGSNSALSYTEVSGEPGNVLSRSSTFSGGSFDITPFDLPGGGFTDFNADNTSSIVLRATSTYTPGVSVGFDNLIVPVVIQSGGTSSFDFTLLDGEQVAGRPQPLYLFSMNDITVTGQVANTGASDPTQNTLGNVTLVSLGNVALQPASINTGVDAVTLIHGSTRSVSSLGVLPGTTDISFGAGRLVSIGGSAIDPFTHILGTGFTINGANINFSNAGSTAYSIATDSPLVVNAAGTMTFDAPTGTTQTINLNANGLLLDPTQPGNPLTEQFQFNNAGGDFKFTGNGQFNFNATKSGVLFITTADVDFGVQQTSFNIGSVGVLEFRVDGALFNTVTGVDAGTLAFNFQTPPSGLFSYSPQTTITTGLNPALNGDVNIHNVTTNEPLSVTMNTGTSSLIQNFDSTPGSPHGQLHVNYQAVSSGVPFPSTLTLDNVITNVLEAYSMDGPLILKNNITSDNWMFLVSGENSAAKYSVGGGTPCTHCGDIGITVEAGANIVAGTNGTINIIVANALPVSSAGQPYITIGSNAGAAVTITDTGCFGCLVSGDMGGGVDIAVVVGSNWLVNTNNANSGNKIYGRIVATRTGAGDFPQDFPAGIGTVNLNDRNVNSNNQSLSSYYAGLGSDGSSVLKADSDGMVRVSDAGTPGSVQISGNSTLYGNGGVVNIDSGDAFFGEILITNTQVTATMPFVPGFIPVVLVPGGPVPVLPGPVPTPIICCAPIEECSGCTVISIDKTPPQQPQLVVPTIPQPVMLVDVSLPTTYVATTNCEEFVLPSKEKESKESMMRGQVGTEFEVNHERTILLKDGRMLVGTGSDGINMKVAGQNLSLKPETLALIETRANKPIRVTVIDSDQKDAVTVTKNDQAIAYLDKGQEAIMADTPLADEELIPVDGVERQAIGGTIVKEGVQVHKSTLAVQELMQKDPFLATCHKRKEKDKLSNISFDSSSTKLELGSVTNAWQPVAYRQNDSDSSVEFVAELPTVPGKYQCAANGGWQLVSLTPVAPNVRLGEGSSFKQLGLNHYRLLSGAAIIEAIDDTKVELRSGWIRATKGAIVLALCDGQTARVQSLCDKGVGKVFLISDNKSLPLIPGQEAIVLLGSGAKVERAISGDSVGRRRMKVTSITDSIQLVTAEFSLVDKLNKDGLLKLLRRSTEKKDQKMVNSIMKSAAALSLSIDRSHGPYSAEFNGGQ